MEETQKVTLFGLTLDELSKVLAASVAIVYINGYIILGIHFFRFGFSQLSPLRPRILEAGLTYAVLCIIPILVGYALAIISNFGRPERQSLYLKTGLVIPISKLFESTRDFLSQSNVQNPPRPGSIPHYFLWFLLPFVLFVVAFFVYALILLAKQRFFELITLTAWCASVCWFLAPALAYRGTEFRILLWYCIIAYSTLALTIRTQRTIAGAGKEYKGLVSLVGAEEIPRTIRALQLSLPVYGLAAYIGILFVYSSLVLPVVPYSLGGGSPSNATLYLKNEQSQVLNVQLIDETDHGFFVLAPGSSRAVFIPREGVIGIYFGSPDSLPFPPSTLSSPDK